MVGYDVARALAILGMVVVHFSEVMAADQEHPRWLATVLRCLDGRAAATFLVLAGIGLTLLARRAVASGDAWAIMQVRKTLVRRGLFLLVVGYLNLVIWSGDILRIYGVTLLLAAGLITAPSRRLLFGALGFALSFLVLFCVLDFEQNWDWEPLTYRGLWTPSGLVRNLFYDGFRSVFPWAGFVFLGMWLGRHRVGACVLLVAVGVAVSAELVSWLLVSCLRDHAPGMDPEAVTALFGTESMPALPLFLLAAGGEAVAVMALCVLLTERWPGRGWNPLAATGRMALTWYFAHIVLGLGMVVALGLVNTETLPVAAGCGAMCFVVAVVVSWLWMKASRLGPLEWLMRRLAG